MQIELDGLSLEELKNLRTRVERTIDGFVERKKREALAAAEATAREHGFNLSELTSGGKTIAKRAPAVAKYADPANASRTWSGRGRRPQWVVDALDSGKTLEDLAL